MDTTGKSHCPDCGLNIQIALTVTARGPHGACKEARVIRGDCPCGYNFAHAIVREVS